MKSGSLLLALGLVPVVLADPVAQVRFSPDGDVLAVAGGETVRLTRLVGPPQHDEVLATRIKQVLTVDWSADGDWLAVGGGAPAQSGRVELWKRGGIQAERNWTGFKDLVYGLGLDPQGRWLAAAAAEGFVAVFDTETGAELAKLEGHTAPVLCVEFSPDGRILASGGADRSIRLWDTASWNELRTLVNHNDAVHAVVFAPDGQTLYTASFDATVRVWDPAIGRMKRINRGFGRGLLGMAYQAEGHRLLAGGADGRVFLAEADTGEIVQEIAAMPARKTAWVQTVDVSADSKWFAWADSEGRYQLKRVRR
ncbi:MAG: WD40 repeat domain-containing protein [Acidobacteriia bacterium]|nr:WD40 repeat domain-containing protein [Terriglobia bacterium]